MSDETRATLDRLMDATLIGPAPIDTLLRSGRTAKRRRLRTLVGAAAVAAVVVAGGGTLVAQSMTSDSGHSDSNVATDGNVSIPGNTVTVRTVLEGPHKYYVEGAVTEFALAPTDAAGTVLRSTSDPQSFGATTRWDNVVAGDWRLTASTRPCSGSCDVLDPPVDTCTADLHIAGPTDVLVTYRWGQPCTVRVLNAE